MLIQRAKILYTWCPIVPVGWDLENQELILTKILGRGPDLSLQISLHDIISLCVIVLLRQCYPRITNRWWFAVTEVTNRYLCCAELTASLVAISSEKLLVTRSLLSIRVYLKRMKISFHPILSWQKKKFIRKLTVNNNMQIIFKSSK